MYKDREIQLNRDRKNRNSKRNKRRRYNSKYVKEIRKLKQINAKLQETIELKYVNIICMKW